MNFEIKDRRTAVLFSANSQLFQKISQVLQPHFQMIDDDGSHADIIFVDSFFAASGAVEWLWKKSHAPLVYLAFKEKPAKLAFDVLALADEKMVLPLPHDAAFSEKFEEALRCCDFIQVSERPRPEFGSGLWSRLMQQDFALPKVNF